MYACQEQDLPFSILNEGFVGPTPIHVIQMYLDVFGTSDDASQPKKHEMKETKLSGTAPPTQRSSRLHSGRWGLHFPNFRAAQTGASLALRCQVRWDEGSEMFNELKSNIVCRHLQTMH